mgnify:CR=1 FL=1
MLLPKDPYILLSFLNARLRDQYADLEDLCASLDADEQSLRETLAGVDYRYDPVYHQFIPIKGGLKMSDCLFCKIVAGEIPSSKVYEDDVCYAFNDIDPQAPTHFLVVPKAHIGSVSEITADNSTVVAHIFEVIAKLTKEKGLDSYRVVSNIGEQAGQSVFHLHFHVLSGRDMTWPPG